MIISAAPAGAILIGGNLGACVNQAAVEVACGLLPVELIDFKAVIHQHDIQLVWSTASEEDNLGYSLQRSADGHGWSEIGFVQGQGSATKQSDYSWMDKIRFPESITTGLNKWTATASMSSRRS